MFGHAKKKTSFFVSLRGNAILQDKRPFKYMITGEVTIAGHRGKVLGKHSTQFSTQIDSLKSSKKHETSHLHTTIA